MTSLERETADWTAPCPSCGVIVPWHSERWTSGVRYEIACPTCPEIEEPAA